MVMPIEMIKTHLHALEQRTVVASDMALINNINSAISCHCDSLLASTGKEPTDKDLKKAEEEKKDEDLKELQSLLGRVSRLTCTLLMPLESIKVELQTLEKKELVPSDIVLINNISLSISQQSTHLLQLETPPKDKSEELKLLASRVSKLAIIITPVEKIKTDIENLEAKTLESSDLFTINDIHTTILHHLHHLEPLLQAEKPSKDEPPKDERLTYLYSLEERVLKLGQFLTRA